MEESQLIKYKELDNHDVYSYSVLRLELSNKQANVLKQAEKRIARYQLSEALNDSKRRNRLLALSVMISELWGMVCNPKLAPVRGLFIAGVVSTAQYEKSGDGCVVVSLTLKPKTS